MDFRILHLHRDKVNDADAISQVYSASRILMLFVKMNDRSAIISS
jgi:hypothetical protein